MYTVVTRMDFHDAFNRAGRGNQFSYEALDTLFDYYENDDIELDVTELCCQWTEHEDIDGYNSNCCTEYSDVEELARDFTVLTIEGTDRFLIANG